ncbi:unnamed protein product, partial [Heterosigma akashiwo]
AGADRERAPAHEPEDGARGHREGAGAQAEQDGRAGLDGQPDGRHRGAAGERDGAARGRGRGRPR